jgi:hypothetical protein
MKEADTYIPFGKEKSYAGYENPKNKRNPGPIFFILLY